MSTILEAVHKAVRSADMKAPSGMFVSCGYTETAVVVIKQGTVVGLRNWVVNERTNEAKCKAYHAGKGKTLSEATLEGGSIEDIIWSVVMAVAMGVYDVPLRT